MLEKVRLTFSDVIVDIIAFFVFLWRYFISMVSGIALAIYGFVEVSAMFIGDTLVNEPDTIALFATLGKVLWEMAMQIYNQVMNAQWDATLAVLVVGFLYALLKAQAKVRRLIMRQTARIWNKRPRTE